jgi:hypothetical protein
MAHPAGNGSGVAHSPRQSARALVAGILSLRPAAANPGTSGFTRRPEAEIQFAFYTTLSGAAGKRSILPTARLKSL